MVKMQLGMSKSHNVAFEFESWLQSKFQPPAKMYSGMEQVMAQGPWPLTPHGRLRRVAGSWLWPGLASAIPSSWTVNQKIPVPVPVSLPFTQNENTFKNLLKIFWKTDFIYFKRKITKRDTGENERYHPSADLVPKVPTTAGTCQIKAKSFIRVSHSRAQESGPSSATFPGTLAGSRIGSKTARMPALQAATQPIMPWHKPPLKYFDSKRYHMHRF